MTKIVTHSTSTAQWQALVKEGQHALTLKLNEDLESYLVFLLMRFTTQAELASSIIATEWLNSHHLPNNARHNQLQSVGDKCLLFSGFFPGQAQKKCVKISYFVDLGQSAYSSLSGTQQLELARLFGQLCENFVVLVDVLNAIRDMAQDEQHRLTPLQAMELWTDTGSQHAFNKLTQTIADNALPLRDHQLEKIMN